MKFFLRVMEYLLIVGVAGGLIVLAIYVINRTIRYTVDLVQREFSSQITWLKTKLPQRKKRRKTG